MLFGNPATGHIPPIGTPGVPAGTFRVTAPYNDVSAVHPVPHKGIDLSDRRCGSPVLAAAAGTVVLAGIPWWAHGANVIRIRHAQPAGVWDWRTEYAHMVTVAVKVGQQVAEGQVIGHVGTTGNSTACHLHFGTAIHRASGAWAPRDPWLYLKQNV